MRRFPNVAQRFQDWVTFHPHPGKELIIFFALVGVCGFLSDIPSKLLLLRLTVKVTVTGTGVTHVWSSQGISFMSLPLQELAGLELCIHTKEPECVRIFL